ncbi:MAG: NCS2 family permease [Clostridiales bacterium]|nr:NCS2 family permease [Clostridiales bacterium]
MFEKLFKLKENNTNVKTEVMAGITTFMTMAYILAVNPSILSETGMNANGVLMATAIGSAIACFCMAFFANYPFALAPAMGINATFTYTFVMGMGVPWQLALFAVFVEGIIFIILSLINVREAIFNAIPQSLKYSISAGIGLFIAFIGFKGAGIVVSNESTFLALGSFSEDFNNTAMTALIALAGIIIMAALIFKRVKGGILLGIVITWILGIILELTGIYQPAISCIPAWTGYQFGSIKEVFGQCFTFDFSSIKLIDFLVIMFTFLFIDLFDTLGTLIGVSTKAGFLDKDGKLPRIKGALLADAVGTTVGAVLGTSTISTYVESSSGVSEGGRTGLAAATTGVLFIIALVLAPLFIAIPTFATAPALIVVGVYMIGSIVKVDFSDFSEGVPAFLAMIMMPFAYSISEGIFFGVISYVIINLVTGKKNRQKITPLMYVLAILFILKYALL